MTSRTLPLLERGLEQDDGKLSASPHSPSHQRTNLGTISLSTQEDTLHTQRGSRERGAGSAISPGLSARTSRGCVCGSLESPPDHDPLRSHPCCRGHAPPSRAGESATSGHLRQRFSDLGGGTLLHARRI